MTRDVELLTLWIQICLGVAAFFTTAFPILYLFSPWHSRWVGRLVMLQAVSFALAIDLTLLFQFWTPTDILMIFWINALVFSAIAVATGSLTVMLWYMNYRKKVEVYDA